jgi:DNA end-binding protein Ku
MAKQLIRSMSAAFDLKSFKDTYRDRVKELLEKKARGEEIVYEEPPEETGQVVDLMEALKASLAAGAPGQRNGRKAARAQAHPARKPTRRRAAAARKGRGSHSHAA